MSPLAYISLVLYQLLHIFIRCKLLQQRPPFLNKINGHIVFKSLNLLLWLYARVTGAMSTQSAQPWST